MHVAYLGEYKAGMENEMSQSRGRVQLGVPIICKFLSAR